MKTRLLALTLLLVALFASVAHAAPTAPGNDAFDTAGALPLSGTVKAKHAQLATTEGGENIAPCDGLTVYNTVSYAISAPYPTTILLRTNASKLPGLPIGASQVSMAAYEQAGSGVGGLSVYACNEVVEPVQNSGFMVLNLSANVTYYLQVGSLMPYAGGGSWKYQVNTRILYTNMESANYSFEVPLDTSNWKLKKGTNDRIECSNPSYPTYGDDCAFVFEGGANEKASLQQTFSMPPGYSFKAGDTFALVFVARDAGSSAEALTASMTVQYDDGTPSSTISVAVSAPNSATPHAMDIALKSGKVKSAKIVFKNKAESGEVILDYVVFGVISAPTRDAAALPLPPAPSGL